MNFQHGGQVYDKDGRLDFQLDFSANINPLGFPDSVRRALLENLEGIVHYPDPNAIELKNAIASHYDVSCENLVMLNGASEFFYLYFNVNRWEKVLIVVPSFSEYERAARSVGSSVEYFCLHEEENFQLDIDKLCDKITAKKFDCLIIGRPNNPTGNIISIDAINKLSPMVNILIDESFIDFIDVESARGLVNDKICVVQSLTKIFAIPGLRLGFAVTDKKSAEKLNASKDVWNVNFLAQKAGVAALKDRRFLQDTCRWLETEKKFFVEQLRELPNIKVLEPTVNFVLIKFDSAELANHLIKKLRAKKILLRSCGNFVGLDERFIRLAIRSRAENLMLIDAILSSE